MDILRHYVAQDSVTLTDFSTEQVTTFAVWYPSTRNSITTREGTETRGVSRHEKVLTTTRSDFSSITVGDGCTPDYIRFVTLARLVRYFSKRLIIELTKNSLSKAV